MTERLARWSLYATAACALFVLPGFYFPFVTVRAVLFRLLTLAAVAALLLLLRHRRPRLSDRRDPILIALVAYFAVYIVSAALGVAPWRSFFGDFERMWGVLTIAHLVLYYALLRVFFREDDWTIFFNIVLVAGGAACAVAIIQWLYGGTRPGGSLGNAGYLGIYSFTIAALSVPGLRRNSAINRKAAIWALITATSAFFIAATRGAMLGAAIAAVWVALNSRFLSRRQLRWAGYGFITLAISITLVAQSPYARHLPFFVQHVFEGVNGGTSVRLIAWESGLHAAADRPLLGWGPENTTPAFNQNFDPAYYQFLPQGDRLDRFHNAYIEGLATTGSIGLAAFLAIWICAVLVLRSARRGEHIDSIEYFVIGSLLITNAVYFVFWFEDLSSFALLIALLAYLRFRTRGEPLIVLEPEGRLGNLIPFSGAAVLAAYAFMHCFMPLRAAYHLEQADGNPNLSAQARVAAFNKALHPAVPQRMHTLLRYTNFVRTLREPEVATPILQRLQGEVALERQRDPRNDVWLTLAAQLSIKELALSRAPLAYYRAISAYQDAIELSPQRVRHRLTLARTYLLARDTTRALQQLRTVQQQYPALGETYTELGTYYSRIGEGDVATKYFQMALDRRFIPEVAELEPIVQYLSRAGEWQRLNTLLRSYFELKYGRDWLADRRGVEAAERRFAVGYALSAALTGRNAELSALVGYANDRDPLLATLLNRLRDDVAAGDLSGWSELVASQ